MGTAQAASVTLAFVDARTAFDANGDGVFDSIITNDPTAGSDFDDTTSRGLIEFDLSSISGNVTSATLKLHRGSSKLGSGFNVEIHGYVGDGVLDLSDAVVDNLIAEIQVPVGIRRDYDVDVTSFVQALPDYAGFMLRLTDETTESVFAAFTNEANLLVVDYSPVPIPAAVWLFGSGLIGLVGVAKRKRA